jgi:hypothetical protein
MTRHAGGRPPKFSEASRAITVTLPDRTLEQLSAVNEDRAKAIVEAVEALVGGDPGIHQRVEVIEVERGTGIIVVPEIPSLRRIPWLRTVKLAPMRHLLVIVSGTPIERVELELGDLLEDCRESAPHEVPLLSKLRELFGRLRKGERISKGEMLFVAMK